MNILKKLNLYEEESKCLCEAGIRNMKQIAKEYKKAEIYFHIDL
jgi:hypothetical protein